MVPWEGSGIRLSFLSTLEVFRTNKTRMTSCRCNEQFVVLSTLGHVMKKKFLLKVKQGLIIHVKHAGAHSDPVDQETQTQSYLMIFVLYSAGRCNLLLNLNIPFEWIWMQALPLGPSVRSDFRVCHISDILACVWRTNELYDLIQEKSSCILICMKINILLLYIRHTCCLC